MQILVVCLSVRYGGRKCMGLFGIAILLVGLWAWDWTILNLEDKTEVRRGTEWSYEDRALDRQVWTGPPEPDLLVQSFYDRVLNPRRPRGFRFGIHPASGLQPGESQGDKEKVDVRWWWWWWWW